MHVPLALQDAEYAKHVRREMQQEMVDALIDVLWRLSTELLKAQLLVRRGANHLPQR